MVNPINCVGGESAPNIASLGSDESPWQPFGMSKFSSTVEISTEIVNRLSGLKYLGVVLVSLALSGCTDKASLSLSARGTPDQTPIKSSYSQFTDIPVPAGASINLEQTLILGERETWIGRLMYDTELPPDRAFDFFSSEMPRFGWKTITSSRSASNTLIFSRQKRAATIQISTQNFGGSIVSMTVSPLETSDYSSSGKRDTGLEMRPLR